MADLFTYDVFLSYNSRDKSRVRKLAEELRAAGLRVWFDEWVIKPGDDIYLAIERGLETARAQVLCLSPNALGSDWVTLERSTVLFRDPTNAGRHFIPLLLADCKLPDALRRYKYVDFRQSTKTEFAELLAACESEAYSAPTAREIQSAQTPVQSKPLAMFSRGTMSAKLQLSLGLALVWVPLGLGAAASPLFDSLVLFVSFVLIARGLWTLERLAHWKISTRWATVLAAILPYTAVIGGQIVDYRFIRSASDGIVLTDPANGTLTLSLISSLVSYGGNTDGDFWMIRDAAPKTLIAANRAYFLRVTNLQRYPVRIDRCRAEAQLANGKWEQMRLVSMVGVREVFTGKEFRNLARLDLTNLSLEENSSNIAAKGSAEGWMFFYDPIDPAITHSQVRISVTDDHGNSVWASRAATSEEGGLRGGTLRIVGFSDLREYRIRQSGE
jgi:hypothetical protein